MNKIYKLIWSKTKNCWIVASELAKGHGKNKSRIKNSLLAVFVMSALLAGGVADVQALTQQEKEEIKNEVARDLLDKIINGDEIPGVTSGVKTIPGAIANRIFHSNDISDKIGEKLKNDGLTLRYFGVRPDYIEPGRDYLDRYGEVNRDGDAVWTNVNNDGAFGAHSMALGYRAFSEAKHGVAIGRDSLAGGYKRDGGYGGDGDVAIGNMAWALGDKAVSIGDKALSADKSIAIGIQAEAGANKKDPKSIQRDPKTKLPYVVSDIEKMNSAIAIGRDTKAWGHQSVALGGGAMSTGKYALSFGNSAEASAMDSFAFGNNAKAKGLGAIAIGSNYDQSSDAAQAYSGDTIAIGRGSVAGNKNDTTTAYNTVAIGVNAKAVPDYTSKKVKNAVLLGASTTVKEERGIAVGANAYVDGVSGAAFGDSASVVATEGLAIGKNAKIAYNSAQSIAIGSGAEVKNENAKPSERAVAVGTGVAVGGNSSDAIAIGTGAQAQGDAGAQRGIAIGKGAVVKSYDSVAIGTNASTQWYNAVAIGNGARATLSDGIALGSDSKTTVISGEKGYDPYTGRNTIDANPGTAWKSTRAALSVGDVGNNITRQITSVAAGRNDTDAVNVAQLKKMRTYTDTKMNSWVLKATSDKGTAAEGKKVNNTDNAVTFDVEKNQGLTVKRDGATIKYGVDSRTLTNHIINSVIENINGGGIPINNISTQFSISGADAATKKNLTLSKTSTPNIQFLGTTDETTVTIDGDAINPTVTVGLDSKFTQRVTTNEGNIKKNTTAIDGLTTKVDANEGNITTNKNAIAGLTPRVTANEGNITKLQAGFTVKDGGTGKADVALGGETKQEVTFKAAVDKTTQATENGSSLTSTVDTDRNVTYKLNMNQLKKDLGITDGPDGVMSSWKLKVKGETTPQEIKNGNEVTFEAAGDGLTVTRTDSTIKYSIDGSKLNIAQNQSITNLGKRIDNLPSIHYFSVKSDDSANPDGTNWKNDGATGKNAIAIGKDAKAERESSVVVGLNASSGDAANDGVAVGSRASVTGFGGVAIGRESSAEGQETVAIGTGAKGVIHRTVAIGGYANADGFGAVSIGRSSMSKERGVSVGTQSFSNYRGVAVGETSIAEAPYAVAVGDLTGSYAMGAVTLGNKTRAFGDSSVAIGNQARVSGKGITPEEYEALPKADQKLYRLYEAVYHNYDDPSKPIVDRKYYKVIDAHDWRAEKHYNSIAIGTTSFVEAKEAIGIGAGTRINGDRGVALGYAAVSEEKGTALGAGAQAKANAGVALGEGAVADTAAEVVGYDPKTGKVSTETTPTWKSVKGAVSVGNADATRQITNLAAGSADTDAVNVAQLKALEGKVTGNAGDITTLKEGWTLADAKTGKKVVKAKDTVKVTGDDYITATVDPDGLKLGMDETKLNSQINNQINDSETVKAKMNSWVLKATSDKDAEKDGKTIDNKNNAVTFDATGDGLTVTRDGSTITYGIDGSKIDIKGNKSITDLQTEIKESKTTVEAAANSQITVTPETQTDKSTKYVVDIAKDGTIGGAKDGNLVTGKTVKDYVDANKVTVTDDGVSGVKVKNIAETGKPANYQVSLGDKIKAGDVTVDGTEGKGQITGLSNTTWDAGNIVSGRAATEDQLKAVSQNAAEAAKKHTTVVAGDYVTVSEGTNANGGKEYTVTGPKVAVAKDEKNLVVGDIMDGDKKVGYELKLNKELTGLTSVSSDTFKSGENVTINKDGLTIKEGPSVTTKGIDAGKKKITNVAKGGVSENSTDAVNGGQLYELQQTVAGNKVTVEAKEGSQITVTPETQTDKSTKYVVDIAKDGTIGGAKDGNLVTGKTVKDYVDANKVTVTDDGVSGVKVENVAKTGEPANYKVSLGDKVKAGDVTVDGTKGAGQITGLSNTKWDADKIVSGRAATEDQLKAVSQNAAEAAKKHTTVVAGDYVTVSEGTNANGGKEYTVTGPKVAVAKDEKNLVVGDIMDGDKKVGYELKLNKELTGLTSVSSDTFKSGENVTINNEGLTIKEGPSVTTKGIDAGKKKITNVADGGVSENSTDAVNGGQLYKLQQTVAGNKVTVEAAKNSQITVTPETQADKSTKYVVDIAKDGTIGGAKDGNLVTGDTVKKYVDANKVTVTGDEDGSGVKVENVAKTGEPANYKVSLGDKVKAGDVTVDGTKGAGQITGLSNTKWDADKIVSGRAATEDQLKAVSQNAAEAAKKHTTVVAGDYVTVSEGTNANGGKEYTVTGPKVAVAKDEKNLVVGDIMDGNKKVGYELKLNKELTGLTSVSSTTFKAGDNVTINNEGLTIKKGPSVTAAGIDAGKKKITNVAAGDVSEKSTEAVNGGQLFGVEQKVNINSRNISILGGKVGELGNRVNRVGAGAAALAALHPLDFDPDDKWDFAAGYGNYKGANAAAIGAYYRPNEDTMVSVGGSFGGGENMVNAGVSVKLGQGNHVTTSRVAMAKEIKDLRAEVEVLRQAVTGIGQGQTPDPVKMKLFPDIAKNHWAYEAVEELTKQGLLEGYPDGTFGGDRMMTRYEFAEIVYRAMQKGLNVNEKLIQEFEPELERFRIDVISKDKNGNPVIERVRVNEKKKAK